MILLDTNVVSEPLRAAADVRVTEWIDAQALETLFLFLSAITVAELRAGLALLPACRQAQGGTASESGDAGAAALLRPRGAA